MSVQRQLKMAEMTGKKCGDFIIQKNIGKGTFGQVYLATRSDQAPQTSGTYQPTNYALKVINISKANRREQELLDREIQILSDLKKFKHTNIVRYVECFRDDDCAYIVMEHCERGSLYDYIRQVKVVNEYIFVDFVRQMAAGLEFLHNKNVLHRDVKSKNILLTGHNEIKIADFGVAREIPIAVPGKMSLFIGSPQYMSPEMLSNLPYDEKTDIWSLGCTCYEMGTGDYAFKADNIQQIKKLVKNRQLPPMQSAGYCEDIKKFIMCMLQNESASRPTAKQVHESISKHTCTNVKTHPSKEINRAISIAKVTPTKMDSKVLRREKPDTPINSHDSGLPPSSVVTDMSTTHNSMADTVSQQDYLTKQSNKYQAQIVRLMGDNKASEHVTKIMKACKRYPADYDKIETTVKKYVKEERYHRIFPLVLALKGIEEAIALQNNPKSEKKSQKSDRKSPKSNKNSPVDT